jgi:transcription antitermination factor NusG
MFPGYLFLLHTMDKASYREVAKTRRLVKVLGDGWDSLAVVPPGEIETIQKVHSSNILARRHEYLREGERVRITQGLLAGVEGIFLRSKPNKGLLVVSIELLQRAVAVEVDCTLVVPA